MYICPLSITDLSVQQKEKKRFYFVLPASNVSFKDQRHISLWSRNQCEQYQFSGCIHYSSAMAHIIASSNLQKFLAVFSFYACEAAHCSSRGSTQSSSHRMKEDFCYRQSSWRFAFFSHEEFSSSFTISRLLKRTVQCKHACTGPPY